MFNGPLDPPWQKEYDERLPEAERIADAMFLVHTTGKINPGTKQRGNFAQIVAKAPHSLLPSDGFPGRTSESTLEGETVLELGRNVYFYAGRVYPPVGGAAIAFAPGCEAGHTGSATPFDTGGLVAGHIFSNLAEELAARIDFCMACMIELASWRQEFAKYLAAYFSPLETYWTDRPYKPDPADIFLDDRNEWRAWTYEVRFHERHRLLDAAAWCASETQWQFYEEELKNAIPTESAILEGFLQQSLQEGGTPEYGPVLEGWVRQQVEI